MPDDVEDLFQLPGELTATDKLFNVQPVASWRFNTDMAWTWAREFRYVHGFQTAAEKLCDQLATSPGDVDALTMPILFCYRQWAELRLKEIWEASNPLEDARHGHDLRQLWGIVRPIMEKGPKMGPDGTLDHVERILTELAEADGPTGTGFRYAFDRDGKPSVQSDLKINIMSMALDEERAMEHEYREEW